jgi:hypothetical protein
VSGCEQDKDTDPTFGIAGLDDHQIAQRLQHCEAGSPE